MYFQLTFFNVVTLCLIAATLLMAAKRISVGMDSNWPLLYYGLLIAYWHGYAYTLDDYWVMGGLLCGLLLRFEFLGGMIVKPIRALELGVFTYVVGRCVTLVLQW
jgi:hypothetical protein